MGQDGLGSCAGWSGWVGPVKSDPCSTLHYIAALDWFKIDFRLRKIFMTATMALKCWKNCITDIVLWCKDSIHRILVSHCKFADFA